MKRARHRWLLKVFEGRNHDLMLHRLGLQPSRYDASEYVGFYDAGAKRKLLRHIEELKRAGLHGTAKRVAAAKPKRKEAPPRRPKAKRRAPDAQVVSLIEAKRARSQREAAQRRAEKRRQNGHVAARDAATAAHRHAEELIRSKLPL